MAKTKVVSKNLYERRNTSDVFNRLVIMGLLRILNNKLKYENIWEDTPDGIQEVTVPFFYNFSDSPSTERFIQDNYDNWTDDECTDLGIKKIAGDYKPLPYGVFKLDSTSIESGSITNRFVMGRYQKKINGQLKSFVACIYQIPLTMNFSVTIGCKTTNTAWKIEQAYREYFYKNKTFRFNYKGTVVSARVGFPDSLTENKTGEYNFGAQSTNGQPPVQLSFSLAVETYQPVFDPDTEQPADNTIKTVNTNILMQDKSNKTFKKYEGTEIGQINPAVNLSDNIYAIGQDILLQWSADYKKTDLLTVDILYEENGDDNIYLLDTVDNHNCYHLEFDDDLIQDAMSLDVIFPVNNKAAIVNLPVIKFFCDPQTSEVSNNTCIVIEPGFIMTEENQINAILQYYDTRIKEYKEIPVIFNIHDNGIDLENPCELKPFIYTGKNESKQVKIYVRDHNNEEIITAFQDDDKWITIF